MERADGFLGVDSGPMHVARAFDIPSLIFIAGSDPQRIFENRDRLVYFLNNNRRYWNLYREHLHMRVDGASLEMIRDAVDAFFRNGIPVAKQRG